MESHVAYVYLEDGTRFQGISYGSKKTVVAEICFNTGMTGYQEIFTDPSYHKQIPVMTNVYIGNYGATSKDVESKQIQVQGFICRELTEDYSRAAADTSIFRLFEDESKMIVSSLDTRALVQHVRDNGAMKVVMSSDELMADQLQQQFDSLPNMEGLELASQVSSLQPSIYGKGNTYKIAMLDFGVKQNIINCFVERDCEVKLFPYDTSFAELEPYNPDGYMLSNGPGDPGPLTDQIALAKQIIDKKKPMFGICLGHQIISLALGLKTYKMHHGHRGINHPIHNLETNRSEITSQNHGFATDYESAEAHQDVIITHKHLNDGTLAGIRLKNAPVFSVQYHPESSPGPHDSRYLFDQFITYLK